MSWPDQITVSMTDEVLRNNIWENIKTIWEQFNPSGGLSQYKGVVLPV